jgi:hypothetical protein
MLQEQSRRSKSKVETELTIRSCQTDSNPFLSSGKFRDCPRGKDRKKVAPSDRKRSGDRSRLFIIHVSRSNGTEGFASCKASAGGDMTQSRDLSIFISGAVKCTRTFKCVDRTAQIYSDHFIRTYLVKPPLNPPPPSTVHLHEQLL